MLDIPARLHCYLRKQYLDARLVLGKTPHLRRPIADRERRDVQGFELNLCSPYTYPQESEEE